MNDDPSQVDVLYAKCEPQDENNTIQQIADLVARKFTEKGKIKLLIYYLVIIVISTNSTWI